MTAKSLESLPILRIIGQTPLYKLNVETGGAEVWIKLEGNNPGGSIKDRAAYGMLKCAQDDGTLDGAKAIVEPTSGNTGIGLALLGRAMGLRVILTMPESMSVERRAILSAFGAELVLTPASEGMAGASTAAEQILQTEESCVMLNQFSHPGNPWAHEHITGPEILAELPADKKLAAFVASFGTGGTVTGIGRAMRKAHPDVEVIAVEPASSPLITEGFAGPHEIQGIGANFVPKNLDQSVVTRFMTVTDDAAIETARRLARDEGLFCGISAGANVFAAVETARNMPKGSVVVTVQPDRGDKYLSVFAKGESKN
jgi:cysteine synthase A